MKTKKIFIGGIAGGIFFFLLGWLIYGLLLTDFMAANSNQDLAKPMDEMIFWALILSNLASGFLLSYVIYWSNTATVMTGVKIGGVLGFLFASAIDFSFYSMTNIFPDLTPIFVDIIAYTVMTAAMGGVVTWVMGMIKK